MDNELPKIKIDERTCIEYHLEGDYYIPNLVMPKQEKITLNKYGNYLKEYKKADYTIMLLDGTLRKHIVDTDIQAKKGLETLMKQMLEKNPIDENLKDTDPLKWTGLMNNYKFLAEEVIYLELINC